jgi:hypothetical protein
VAAGITGCGSAVRAEFEAYGHERRRVGKLGARRDHPAPGDCPLQFVTYSFELIGQHRQFLLIPDALAIREARRQKS